MVQQDRTRDCHWYPDPSPRERCEVIADAVRVLSPENKLNLLLCDGEILYVHTNKKGTLYHCKAGESLLFATVPFMTGISARWKGSPLHFPVHLQTRPADLSGCPARAQFCGRPREVPLADDGLCCPVNRELQIQQLVTIFIILHVKIADSLKFNIQDPQNILYFFACIFKFTVLHLYRPMMK